MFTFKYLIETGCLSIDLKEKVVSRFMHTSCFLLGAEGDAEGEQQGLLPSRDFHLRYVGNPRECLGVDVGGWVGEGVDLIRLFKFALQTPYMVSGTSISLY